MKLYQKKVQPALVSCQRREICIASMSVSSSLLENYSARSSSNLCEIWKASSISRFEHESQKKARRCRVLALDPCLDSSIPRFSNSLGLGSSVKVLRVPDTNFVLRCWGSLIQMFRLGNVRRVSNTVLFRCWGPPGWWSPYSHWPSPAPAGPGTPQRLTLTSGMHAPLHF